MTRKSRFSRFARSTSVSGSRPVNAIHLPLGETEYAPIVPVQLVSISASPPSTGIRYKLRFPLLSDAKKTHVESGENAGALEHFSPRVSCIRPEPSLCAR